MERMLEEPLVDQETMEAMVWEDEDLKVKKKHELGKAFSAIRDEHEKPSRNSIPSSFGASLSGSGKGI
jgi:hypothetical protein